DAEVGLERGERVVGDLGLGPRDARDQRALARVGEADEGDVGHELELEAEPPLLSHLALLGEARRPSPVGEEAGVAATTSSAAAGEPALTMGGEVGQRAVVAVPDDGAGRDRDLEVVALAAVPALARAVAAVAPPPVGVVAEGEQGRNVVVGDEPDVAAL